MPYWTDILRGAQKTRERQRLAEEPGRKEEKERARDILKAVLEGTIEPTERPEEALFRGPRREVATPDIGARIMEGFGIRRPQYEPGQMYRRPPVTAPTAGAGEKMTTRYGPRGAVAGYTVSPEVGKKPTEWELQKEAQDEAFRQLGGSYMVGLDEKSRIEYETLSNQLYQRLRRQYGYGETTAPSPRPSPQGRITIESPDGTRGTIPANQLQEALKAGYKQVR